MEKSRQQGREAAGHTVSIVRKQREVSAGAQLTSSFIQNKTPSRGAKPSMVEVGLPIPIYLIYIFPTAVVRGFLLK